MGGSRLRVPEVGALVVFLLALCIFFSVKSEFFLGYENFLNILTAAAITGIIACPATMLLVAGQFDLSVGSALTFCRSDMISGRKTVASANSPTPALPSRSARAAQ